MPALVAGLSMISAAVAVGVVSTRTSQSHAATQDSQLAVAARQVSTSLTETLERVRTIDLMTAHEAAFAAFATDPRPRGVKLAAGGDITNIDDALRFLDQVLPGALDGAGFADIHGVEAARYDRGHLALPGELGSVRKEPYFNAALLMGPNAVYRTDPFVSDVSNAWVLGHSTLVTHGGVGVGVVYVTITMDSLRTAMLGAAQHGETLRVLDGESGQVLMDSRIGEDVLLDSEATAGGKPVERDDAAMLGAKGLDRRTGVSSAGSTRMAFAPVANAQQDVGSGWVVVASAPVAAAGGLGSLGWLALVLLALGLALVAVGVAAWAASVRRRREESLIALGERDRLAERLGAVSGALSRVGAGDLGVVLPVEEFAETDEVLGGLVGGFEDTIGRLRVLVGSAQSAGEHVAGSAAELLVLAARQADSAGEQSAAVTETTVTIQQLAATASQIAESAQGVAMVAGEMLALTEAGRRSVSDSVSAMERIAGRVGTIADSAQVLGDKVAEIGGILALLDDLSDQTNLLALNAAIEAARAGEHGRGFAVVAGEVRKLAERARASTARIQGLVSEISALMGATVTASGQGAAEVAAGQDLAADAMGMLDQIAGRVEEAATSVKEISVATQQQRSASDQVVVAMTRLSQVSTMYAAGSRQAEASAQELAALAATMQASIETFRTSTEETTDLGDEHEAHEEHEGHEEREAPDELVGAFD